MLRVSEITDEFELQTKSYINRILKQIENLVILWYNLYNILFFCEVSYEIHGRFKFTIYQTEKM